MIVPGRSLQSNGEEMERARQEVEREGKKGIAGRRAW